MTHPLSALQRLEAVNQPPVERIKKLISLERNWDGYGGRPMTQDAINTTATLLLRVHGLTGATLPDPFIAPLPDGGFQLEWESPAGAELILVIPPGRERVRYLLDIPDDSGEVNESEGTIPEDASLSELLLHLT